MKKAITLLVCFLSTVAFCQTEDKKEGTSINGLLQGKGKMTFANGKVLKGVYYDNEIIILDNTYLNALHKRTVALIDSSNIYISEPGDKKLYYFALVPKAPLKGVLVLLPSTGETVENVINCNKVLMQKTFDEHIMSIVLSINFNKNLEDDPTALPFLDMVFKQVIEVDQAPKDKFILSGLSLGGETALRYTQMSRDANYRTAIAPIAVIGVDPPVDEAGLYKRAHAELERFKNISPLSESEQAAIAEDTFLMKYYQEVCGGTPEQVPERYRRISNYSLDDPQGGNARYLKKVPIRIYSDPDITWAMHYKKRTYYDINAADQSAMINFLQMQGNDHAEFIPALGKGYRLDGSRHPHSWSIVDPDDAVRWMLQWMQEKK